MQTMAWTKKLVLTILLTWPWLMWLVAKNSPEMILKGFSNAGSIWMPILLDLLICLGGLYAIRTRPRLTKMNQNAHASAVRGPHFRLAAQRQQSKTQR